MKDQTLEALQDIAEVFKFELWLRFYFIQEQDQSLRIDLEPEVLEKMKEDYGHLGRLAEQLNNREIDPSVCQKAIVEHILDEYDGKKYEIGYIPKILDMAVFKAEIELFNTWAHLHENQLDQKVLGFQKWMELYDEWKQSENARKMEMSFTMQDAQQMTHPGSEKTN